MNLGFKLSALWRRAHKLFFIDKSDWEPLGKDRTREQIIEDIEKTACTYFGVKRAILVSSGREGIELIMRAQNVAKRDSLVTQAFACYDVMHTISKSMKVDYCDVAQHDFNFSGKELSKVLSKNTKIIMPLNLYGFASPVDQLRKICKARKIFLLEDAAHAWGAQIGGKKVGTLGDAAVFSFAKSFACASGGLVLTNDNSLAGNIKSMRENYEEVGSYGLTSTFGKLAVFSFAYLRKLQYFFPFGLVFFQLHAHTSLRGENEHKRQMDAFELSLCLSQMKKSVSIVKHYRDNYARFYDMMKGVKGLKVVPLQSGNSALRFPIMFDKEQDISAFLKHLYSYGSFEPSLNYFREYRHALKIAPRSLPNSEALSKRLAVVALDNLSGKDLNQLKEAVVSYLNTK
jgi:dTDP-4-amino-4,6-dideoxygalactose transaminase